MRALIWSQAGITWYHIRTSNQIFALGLVVLSKKEESVFRGSFSYLQVFFLRIAITFFNHCVPKSHALFVVKLRFGLFYLICIENIFVSRFIHYKLLKSSSSNNIIIVNAIMRRKHHCTLTIPTLASSAPIP